MSLANTRSLVSVDWLADRLGDPRLKVLDGSSSRLERGGFDHWSEVSW